MAMVGSKESTPTQRYFPFMQRMSMELNTVAIDHCYAKPWSSHPDASNARPLQMLFMDKNARLPTIKRQSSEDVDVDGEDPCPPALYDVSKAHVMMSECSQHASLLRPDLADGKEDWEDHFASVRPTWSVQQNRLFAKVMKVLQADRLARLSIVGVKDEPIHRRLQIDKAAKRVRFAFGNIGWTNTLTLWLHNLLLEKLRGQLLTSYLEVLQKLKAKIPSLIDRLIQGTSTKQGSFGPESLTGILKGNWDPVISSINNQKLKKLPDNPLLLLIPGVMPSPLNPASQNRYKFWHSQFASMGKVVNVVPVSNAPSMVVANFVQNMIATTRSKILEMKSHFPNRLIVLVGWNAGALVALQVSLVEAVHAVVCLSIPTKSISGNRGEVDDTLLNCKTPTLFVVGQHASATNLDCLEDIRESLRVETALVLVGGADDKLRMVRTKKRRLGLTQAMVDRCIVDEMYEFLGGVLSQAIMQPAVTEEKEGPKKPQKKRKAKDLSSTAGSQTVDSLIKPPKKMKTMKMASVGTASFGPHGLITGTYGKKSPPKKKLAKVANAGEKPFLHLTLPVIATKPGENMLLPTSMAAPATLATTPSLSEAAAIASAPELSTLLQSIKTSAEQVITSATKTPIIPTFISSKISSTSLLSLAPSPVLPTSNVSETLSKYLVSNDPVADDTKPLSDGPVTSENSKSFTVPVPDELDIEHLSEQENSPVKQVPQQPKFLLKSGALSSISTPTRFSIPLTLSMASKVLKSGVIMKPTSQTFVPVSSQQSSDCGSLTQASASSSEVLKSTADIIGLGEANSLLPLSSSAPAASAPGDFLTTTTPGSRGSPQASIITMGSDTVSMKERPPSTASAPATVSIDLGQISTENSGNPIKLHPSASTSSSSRISLIPTIKHVPLSISMSSSSASSASSSSSSSPDRVHLSSPVSFTRSTVASLSQGQPFLTISKPQPQLGVSLPTMRLVACKTTQSTQAPTILQTSPRFGLSGLTSSQLLSTLSTSSGVIRFKLASTKMPKPGGDAEVKGKDETDGQPQTPNSASDPFANSSKLPTFIDLTDDKSSPPEGKKVGKTVSALSSGQTLSLLSLKTAVRNPVPTNVIISPGGRGLKQISNLGGIKHTVPSSVDINLSSTPVKGKTETLSIVQSTATTTTTPSQSVTSKLDKVSLLSTANLKPQVSPAQPQVTPVSQQSNQTKAQGSPAPTSSTSTLPVSETSLFTKPKPPVLPQPLSSPPPVSTPLSPPSPTVSPTTSKQSKTPQNSYTATPKPVLSTIASTRTRRIKIPKQYDL